MGRVDVELVARGLATSRSAAQRLIADGAVSRAGGTRIERASQQVGPLDELRVADSDETRFVSRAGAKLAHALAEAGIDPTGRIVLDLGMSDLGPVVWGDRQEGGFLGGMSRMQNYSEETARRIDSEVRAVLNKAYDTAREIVRDNLHVVHKVAQALVDRETLEQEEFAKIVKDAIPVSASKLEWMAPRRADPAV